MPPEQVTCLEEALTAAGSATVPRSTRAPSNGHTMADAEAYNPEAAECHWTALLDLFGRNL